MSGKNIRKWNSSARSAIILQKMYGVPFYRLSKLQLLSGIPIADTTLWQQCYDFWMEVGRHIFQALYVCAANSNKLFSDDTTARILEVTADNKDKAQKERKAAHTTNICAAVDGKEIILFISKANYCAENLTALLEGRESTEPLKLMTDASNQNNPNIETIEIIHGKCLAHARRKFYELRTLYPDECNYFLERIGLIYKNEKETLLLTAEARLKHHQEHSFSFMDEIYQKIDFLFDEKKVEPNSSLGKAMRYWVKNKDGLTKFLQIADAAIDNNKSERSLKNIILQRKNSLFFKTKDSAEILSGIASIVSTCEANNINAFEYLNWIQDNYKSVAQDASKFLPWMHSLDPPIAA